MPLYDMHCNHPGCDYTGEYLLRHRDETLQCPRCEEGELVRNKVQSFNVGKSDSGKGDSNQKLAPCPACMIMASVISAALAYSPQEARRSNPKPSKN